jgi:hypothetical protein
MNLYSLCKKMGTSGGEADADFFFPDIIFLLPILYSFDWLERGWPSMILFEGGGADILLC